jgi:hypothetical protein
MSNVEAIDPSSRKPVAQPVTRPGIPRRHHHLAYSTHDTRATIEFYTRLMGMSLVGAVIDDRIPSTKRRIHLSAHFLPHGRRGMPRIL